MSIISKDSTFLGYRRENGRAGTRNEIWVLCTVGCVANTARRIAEKANQRFAGRVDAVQADAIALDAFLKSEAGACCEYKGDVAADLEILGPGVGIGLRKDETELKGKLNAAIKAIRAGDQEALDEYSVPQRTAMLTLSADMSR